MSKNEIENTSICKEIKSIHSQHPDMGYRRIRDELYAHKNIHINDKRALRLCRKLKIQSHIKWKPRGCTRSGYNPQHTAENILNREFKADRPNEKWVTDVSEFKYIKDGEVKKLYLSAILDLYGRRIVCFKISDHNDNELAIKTIDRAIKLEPDAHPIFHSDRGNPYRSSAFRSRLDKQNMIQSMSRVGRCTDNGPMEGFWGILKRESYYLHELMTKDELIKTIKDYIKYYNNNRIQRGLGLKTPMEYHNEYSNCVA